MFLESIGPNSKCVDFEILTDWEFNSTTIPPIYGGACYKVCVCVRVCVCECACVRVVCVCVCLHSHITMQLSKLYCQQLHALAVDGALQLQLMRSCVNAQTV